jgi:peptidoglycan/LPS O-acetylase OafA/YrhL
MVAPMLGLAVPARVDVSLILRGLFACAVVWWHVDGYRGELPGFVSVPGRVSVWVFFGLSGYVIAHGFFSGHHSLTRSGIAHYLLVRAARILPLFWLASVVAVVLRWPEVDFGRLPAQLLALQWSHMDYLVGVFWTLGVELQFYLVVPAVAAALLLAGQLGLALAAAGWLCALILFGGSVDKRTLLESLPHFLAGVAMARLATSDLAELMRPRFVAWGAAVVAIAALAAASEVYRSGSFWGHLGALTTDLAVVALLALHISVERRAIPATLPTRLLMGVGVLAYGIYAWHGVVLEFHMPLSDHLAVTLAASIALAVASYLALERPVLAWARSLRAHATGSTSLNRS